MLRTKLIIAAWILLLVPTLLLGVGAWTLLQNEEERLSQRNRQSAAERLASVAGNLELAIAEVKDGLTQRLISFEGGDLPQLLGAWREENPLVRNVFIWQSATGLIYPAPEMPASDEERQFVRRYLPLFSSELNWQPPLADQPQTEPSPSLLAADSILNERKELRQLASKAPAASGSYPNAEAILPVGESGWRSWYADDQLHLLGWYQPAGAGQRYGVEVEMMALLSRLLGTLNPAYASNESLALVDGNGQIFHQSGPSEITPLSQPNALRNISGLPHWQLNNYPGPAEQQSSSGFLLIGSLLTGSFVAAILLGGSLLLWLTLRHQRDARQKTSFVSNVSHELKTPLTTIRMYAELLGEGKITSARKQQSYLQTIIRESQRLTRLVNNILDFSRLEQSNKAYHYSHFNLVELIEEILAGQLLRLDGAGLELKKQLSVATLSIHSDRDAIEQILINLIDNALKYAAQGKELVIDLQETDNRLALSLIDSGPGIAHEQRQQIFDKFHRLDNSLTSTSPGAGLGLSIARQLARDLGGDLTCTSTAGTGSCFCLRLPLNGEQR